MGASLGGLAMLHEHCRYAESFDALFLQSSSFFSPRYDEHEQRFSNYRRIARFVTSVHRAISRAARPGRADLRRDRGERGE